MNFSNFTKISSGNLIYFRNETPIESVGSIKFYKDNASGTFLKKEMRWSFDRIHWASWEDLNTGNIVEINTRNNKYLFFEIKYTMTSPTAGKVSSFAIDYLPNTGQTYAPGTDANMSNGQVLSDGCNDLGGTVKRFEVVKITDAETLCGKSCDYYLWRSNHKGTQAISTIDGLQNIITNLNNGVADSINNALNVDGSGVGTFFNKSGRNLFFKRIAAGSGIFIAEDPNGIITIGVDASLNIHDPSINDLYNLIADLSINFDIFSIYVDNQFLNIDLSINDLYLRDSSSLKNIINLPGGTGNIFKQIVNQEAELRSIIGLGDVSVYTSGDQIIVYFSPQDSSYPIWRDPDPISADVGGLVAGEVIPIGSNSMDIFKDIFYEYFPANVNLYLDPLPGYYEKYNPFVLSDVSVYGDFNNSNFVKALITDISAYATILGGFGHTSYLNVSSGVFEFNDGGFNSGYDDITYTTRIYSFNKDTSAMFAPFDVSAEIKLVPPYIWGVISSDMSIGSSDASLFNMLTNFYTLGQKLITPKQTNSVIYTSNHQKFVYAYPASYGDLSSIFDVKNDFNVTTSFESRDVSFNYQSSPNIPYKVYIKSHWIDVSSFKLNFNI
jgi:hypothetical protein